MKILSITAAQPGWVAKFNFDGKDTFEPVAVWAVVQDKLLGDSVVGFSTSSRGGLCFDEENETFVCYESPEQKCALNIDPKVSRD